MADSTQRLAVELPGSICSENFEIQAGQGISNQSAERLEWPLQVDYNPAAGTILTGGQTLFIDISSIHLVW